MEIFPEESYQQKSEFTVVSILSKAESWECLSKNDSFCWSRSKESSDQISNRDRDRFNRSLVLWSQFTEKYGMTLRPQFVENGLLVGINGNIEAGSPSVEEFQPDRPEMVKARSDEILTAAQELLGIQQDLPCVLMGSEVGR